VVWGSGMIRRWELWYAPVRQNCIELDLLGSLGVR
jgi:hypothetical protein